MRPAAGVKRRAGLTCTRFASPAACGDLPAASFHWAAVGRQCPVASRPQPVAAGPCSRLAPPFALLGPRSSSARLACYGGQVRASPSALRARSQPEQPRVLTQLSTLHRRLDAPNRPFVGLNRPSYFARFRSLARCKRLWHNILRCARRPPKLGSFRIFSLFRGSCLPQRRGPGAGSRCSATQPDSAIRPASPKATPGQAIRNPQWQVSLAPHPLIPRSTYRPVNQPGPQPSLHLPNINVSTIRLSNKF